MKQANYLLRVGLSFVFSNRAQCDEILYQKLSSEFVGFNSSVNDWSVTIVQSNDQRHSSTTFLGQLIGVIPWLAEPAFKDPYPLGQFAIG